MPLFEIELSDGRKFQVEADRQPTESEILAQLPKPETAASFPSADEMLRNRQPSLGGRAMVSEEPQQPSRFQGAMDALQSMAHPSSASDMLTLALPTGVGIAGKMLSGTRIQQGMDALPKGAMDAARNAPGMMVDSAKALISGGLRKIPGVGQTLDAFSEARAARAGRATTAAREAMGAEQYGGPSVKMAQPMPRALPTPKPNISAQDMVKIRVLVQQGIPEADALKLVLK